MQARRFEQQPAYVLQTHPWRETSLIVDMLSRDAGRVALVAKGARRPLSQWRGQVMAFQPLLASWSGRGEVRTLTALEWVGGQPLMMGVALMCAYYANELLLRLLARDDPHPRLFEAYARLLAGLAAGQAVDPILRGFELAVLRELGYAPQLDTDTDGEAVRSGRDYVFIIDRGPAKAGSQGADPDRIAGTTLLDLARGDLSAPATLVQAKALMRRLIAHQLGDQPLQSRRIFMELQEL